MFTRIAATGGYATQLPGGVFYDRMDDTPDGYPYAVFTVTAEDPRLTLESVYFQTFVIQAQAYCPISDMGAVTVNSVEQFLNTAICSDAAATAFQAASLRNATEKFLDAFQSIPSGEYDNTLRNAKDVFGATVRADILAQGDSSVA